MLRHVQKSQMLRLFRLPAAVTVTTMLNRITFRKFAIIIMFSCTHSHHASPLWSHFRPKFFKSRQKWSPKMALIWGIGGLNNRFYFRDPQNDTSLHGTTFWQNFLRHRRGSPYLSEKSSDFDEIWYNTADIEHDDSHMTKNWIFFILKIRFLAITRRTIVQFERNLACWQRPSDKNCKFLNSKMAYGRHLENLFWR